MSWWQKLLQWAIKNTPTIFRTNANSQFQHEDVRNDIDNRQPDKQEKT